MPVRRSLLRQALGTFIVRAWRPLGALTAKGAVVLAAGSVAFLPAGAQDLPAGPDDELLVRLRSKDVPRLRRFVRDNGVEVLRMLPPEGRERDVTAIVLMRRRTLGRAREEPGLQVEVLAEPPKTLAEVPQVGKGNRFADPGVLPEGVGQLVR